MGHVNLQHYYHLAAHAIFGLTEKILLAREAAPPRRLFFTLESRMLYKSELGAPENIEAHIRPLSRGEKTIKVLIQVFAGRMDAAPAALCELTGGYSDPATRRLAPLLESSRAIFDEKLATGANDPHVSEERSPGAPLPPPGEAQKFVSFQGSIQPDWIDRMGHMGIEHYGLIFERASRGLLHGLGFDLTERRAQGMGAFALETRMKHMKELSLGDPFQTISWMLALGEKTAQYHHELVAPGAGRERIVYASCDHTMAFADLKTRRATPAPVDFRRRIAGLC